MQGSMISETGPAARQVARLHEEHASQLYAFACSILHSREDAEDVVQLAFLNAFNSLQLGATPANELSWLYCITRNACLNRLRTRRRKPAGSLDGVDVPSPRGVDDALEQRMCAAALRTALDRLPAQQRTAIVMRELQGASHTEIAHALDTTNGAVESLLFRARRRLTASLGQLRPLPAVTA